MNPLLQTPLYTQHQELNAKIVDFGGWALPVNYGSQIEEHHAVRQNCGIFDVSHMTVWDISGTDTLNYLSLLLANDIEKIAGQQGKAMYSCMLNEQGGVIDDLIVYYLSDQDCRMVTNAGTKQKVLAWLKQQSKGYDVQISEKPELALIAVQGPNALDQCKQIFAIGLVDTINQLQRFQGAFWGEQFVGRTGYTGEDGIELIVASGVAQQLWQQLTEAGLQPCGLGARDTLRLEAGMSLYGADLDEQHTPLESGLGWTVSKNTPREFNGKSALLSPAKHKMIGLVLHDRGVLRGHQRVFIDEQEIGEITSGTFSPTLEKSIALARVRSDSALTVGQSVNIQVRNKFLHAEVVPYPFVKDGKSAI